MAANRRLLTIFYADVVAYSRLSGLDEEGTHTRVMDMLDAVTARITADGGSVLRYAGDAVLATFPSVVGAVATSIAIQEDLDGEPPAGNGQDRLQIRIGIHLGDVIEDRGEVFGDGVNLAARLESAAEPGGICLSDAVFSQIDGKIHTPMRDGGSVTFKNIDHPVRVWHWPVADAAVLPASKPAPQAGTITPAIAVLPFANMSNDPEQDYFADGLTEDIITALSHWRSIPVIARNSVFTYRGQNVRVQQVAEELGVNYVLEGSVRKAGQRLRITGQLIDALTGHHVWAEKYDRQLEDIFEVQDEITNRLAAIVVPAVEQFENRRVANLSTSDLNAWDHYLKGMKTFYDEDCPGTRSSIREFQAAVDIDPNYGDAWARLSWSHAKLVMHGCVDDPEPVLATGFEAGRKAIAIDEQSALAHLALGTVHIFAEETEQGLACALRAVELNPNFAHAGMAAGNRLDLVGRTDEGIAMMINALRLNPRDPIGWRYMSYLSRAYLSQSDLDTAEEWARKAVEIRPDHPEPLFRYAVVLAHMGAVEKARDMLDRCTELDPHYVAAKSDWRPYPDAARNAHILDGLRRHDLIA